MIIYRVSSHDSDMGHCGYHYFQRKRDALECIAELKANGYSAALPQGKYAVSEWMERLECPVTGRGMIRVLNFWGDHNDNG